MVYQIKTAIAGGFDPLHEGHVDHIEKAMDLCDVLLIFIASDGQIERKKGHRANIKYEGRREIVELVAWGIMGRDKCRCTEVRVSESRDQDLSIASSILSLVPDYLAKGGDRTPDNMPQVEIDACKEVGCTIIYGVGDLLNASSTMVIEKRG